MREGVRGGVVVVEDLERGGGAEGIIPGKMAMACRGEPFSEGAMERPCGGDEVFPEFEGAWGWWIK